MKVGFFTNRFSQFAPFEVKRKLVGWNTGNMIFRDAIHKMIDCDILATNEPVVNERYNAFITTDLIWLKESVAPWPELFKQLQLAGDKALVPISIGLQSHSRRSDFQLHPKMVAYMSALQERATLAVRGAYTAEILATHGIANVEVMGCPSIYQLPYYNKSLGGLMAPATQEIRTTANFRTMIEELSEHEKAYLKYVMDKCDGFAEQTFDPLSAVGGVDQEILTWMKRNSYILFDLDSWRRYNMRYDFSMGLRFHGNVAALLANIPALFMVIDSRTSEMTDFLKLPAMNFSDFNPDLSLQTYYEKADYSEFVASYPAQLTRFKDYTSKHGLTLTQKYKQALDNFVQ